VDKSAGRALYYYSVEAQHSKESSPLLLWLNGGTYLYLILWYFLSRSMFFFSDLIQHSFVLFKQVEVSEFLLLPRFLFVLPFS
jgi:hypothetical protein